MALAGILSIFQAWLIPGFLFLLFFRNIKIFGEGGVRKTAEEFEKEFLGEIPINPEVGKNGDEGKPIVEANPEHEISKIYLDFANKIKSTYL